MFRTTNDDRDDGHIASDIAALLRSGVLLALRRPDGEIGFLAAAMASDAQRAAALDPETVIRDTALIDPTQN